MKVSAYTLGCRLNQCESESILDAFRKEGFEIVGENDESDLVILNTCTVTGKAEQKARRMLRLFCRRGSLVLVTGCYAATIGNIEDNSVIVPLAKKASLLSLPRHLAVAFESGMTLKEALKSFTDVNSTPFDYSGSSFSYHSRAYLKIQDGCDNACAYCRVHVVRGKSVFLEKEEIFDRVKALEAAGFEEIVLTGVNLTMYDHEGIGLGGLLLELIPRLDAKTHLRLSSMEPDHIDEKLIKACESEHLMPHFHIPVQSASDKVLKRVDRKYSKSHLEYIISELRRVKDDPFIACDVITGLPAEEDGEFAETVEFLRRNHFAALHVFPFSPRPDTPLYTSRDKCEERVRDERAEVLRKLSEELHADYVSRQIGKECIVLAENRRNGAWHGTTGNYLKAEIKTDRLIERGRLYRGRIIDGKSDGAVTVSLI
jgi:MiaB-like tRNA modifying enzyme